MSRVQEGVLTREERFGFVILDTGEREGQEVWRDAREFIQLWSYQGERRVEFSTAKGRSTSFPAKCSILGTDLTDWHGSSIPRQDHVNWVPGKAMA
ncbi:MAG TPA: hypothetical protein VHI11_08495 [Jiangellaceae bacterium]|nr:hypothetical protein [Jiangellaceae bacterium]